MEKIINKLYDMVFVCGIFGTSTRSVVPMPPFGLPLASPPSPSPRFSFLLKCSMRRFSATRRCRHFSSSGSLLFQFICPPVPSLRVCVSVHVSVCVGVYLLYPAPYTHAHTRICGTKLLLVGREDECFMLFLLLLLLLLPVD